MKDHKLSTKTNNKIDNMKRIFNKGENYELKKQ